LIVCDLTRQDTLANLEEYCEQLREVSSGANIVLVGNKLDLMEEQQIGTADLEALGKSLGGPFLLTSAKTGNQVEAAMGLLADLIES
jgi:GTPase SAR1 family protein